jgi:cyclase
MPLPRLIPCLDVAAGRVVKGVRFRELRDVGDPVELGEEYSSAGADELVFLDVSASLEARGSAVEVAARVAERVSIPFTVGGGIQTVSDATAVLEAGADKISVNSAALAQPRLIEDLAAALGSQAVVVAIDTEHGRVRSHSATRHTGRKTVAWARECEGRGAGELLVTSIDRDGTRTGYDLDLLTELRDAVSLPVIASGGAGSAAHVAAALGVAQAALLASILHENPARLASLRDELRDLGIPLRDAA